MTYTNTKVTPIAADVIHSRAPSVYAKAPAPCVSDKYRFVSTADVLAQLAGAGYVVTHANQSIVRDETGSPYAKHMVRLTHEKYIGRKSLVGDVIPQVLLTNSHNRTSAFHLAAGLYRLICSNGMATSAGNFTSLRVLHNDADINRLVVEGANRIAELTEEVVIPKVEKMTTVMLTAEQELQFATAATILKHGVARPQEAALYLEARREEDAKRSMWNVLNKIQENAVKGGYQTQDASGRTVVARGIKSVTRDYDFNVRLWQLASKATEALTA